VNRWPTKPLEETAKLCGGSTPSRDNPAFWNGDIHWVTPTDLPTPEAGISIISTAKDRITQAGLENSSATLVPAGTVLFSSRATIGKVAVAGTSLTTNQGFVNFIPHPNVNSRYLAYTLWNLRDDIARLSGSTTFREVSRTSIRKYRIPVPPLVEQGRVVKLLDVVDKLRKLRAQADRRSADLIPALFHEMFGRHIKQPPVVVSLNGTAAPQGWRWSRLTDVARLATGHTPSRRVPRYWNGNIPWISLTDIRAIDGTIAKATIQSVTEKGIDNSSAVKLPKGTVCFSRTASVGFVTVMGREMCTSQDFVNWVCGEEIDPIYLMGALMQARQHLRSLASGSTHQTIYFPTVEQFCVPIPPLPIQKQFANRVTEIHKLDAQQAANRERLDALFQSMLHRAFRGEL
jgi:type I restriction enzyme S subunit